MLVIDTHLHLYPCYEIVPAIKGLMKSLNQIQGDTVALGILCERYDCHYFKSISQGDYDQDFTVDNENASSGVVKITDGGLSLFLYAGRQIVSSERVEIAALTTDSQIPDGLPAKEIIERVLSEDAIPVLNWAPGKWFFKRKKVIQDLLDRFSPNQLLLGDSSLRPTVWREPILMKRARKKGYSVICGSDPLPFSGEESIMGRYYSTSEAGFDVSHPVKSLRQSLKSSEIYFERSGERCTLLQTINRLYKNKKASKG